MIGNLIHKLLKKNQAPEWFYLDMKNKVPEAEIKNKIRAKIKEEVTSRGYDLELWTDEFITKMTALYYKYFDQLYMH